MNEIIFMVQEPPEGGFAAEALGYPIFTVGKTLEELNEMVRGAVIASDRQLFCALLSRIAVFKAESCKRDTVSTIESLYTLFALRS
jgi:hypothetical protein